MRETIGPCRATTAFPEVSVRDGSNMNLTPTHEGGGRELLSSCRWRRAFAKRVRPMTHASLGASPNMSRLELARFHVPSVEENIHYVTLPSDVGVYRNNPAVITAR